MLTAAVAGGVFASPSVEAVLSTIRAIAGPKGCLVIVKNYTGDRINFGLAVEQAKLEGHQVSMVIVGEDVALCDKGIAGRRGLAGTVLVHKVAGAAAESGASLEEVRAEAQATADAMGTMGVALSVCTLPGAELNTRLAGADAMELGLGIHGEPGAEACSLRPVRGRGGVVVPVPPPAFPS
jgi:dihydroxyacetone kinase